MSTIDITFESLPKINHQVASWQIDNAEKMTGAYDLFWLNQFVYKSPVYLIQFASSPIGYCFITAHQELTELYIEDKYKQLTHDVFDMLIKNGMVQSAIASTRHPEFFSACLDIGTNTEVKAYLFTDDNAEPQPKKNELIFSLAHQDDIPWLLAHELYSAPLIDEYIANKSLYILLDREKKLAVGTCLLNPLQDNYADIGTWVLPTERGLSFGEEVILRLKKICYQQGIIPSCGCDKTNQASKRMLEKCGFYATDRMVKILFDRN